MQACRRGSEKIRAQYRFLPFPNYLKSDVS